MWCSDQRSRKTAAPEVNASLDGVNCRRSSDPPRPLRRVQPRRTGFRTVPDRHSRLSRHGFGPVSRVLQVSLAVSLLDAMPWKPPASGGDTKRKNVVQLGQRTCLRSSADKATFDGLSVHLAFRLERRQSESRPVSISSFDHHLALYVITGQITGELRERRSLTSHCPPIRVADMRHDANAR